MSNNKRRIAIIGGGISGIVSIKSCKEEENLFSEIICYEKTSHAGGLWMYREFGYCNRDDISNNNSIISDENPRISPITTVMKGTIANSSKEMSAFSDFPPTSMTPNFMHHRQMLNYILSYAKKFDCLKHIQYNTEVIKLRKLTNKMSLTLKVHKNGDSVILNEIFDIVLIASGHHGRPYMPNFPGQDEFQGEIIHTHTYKKPEKFTDKKVLVVGAGNSALDVAVEVSNVADEVYLSTRSGCWVLPRLGFKGGRPFDTNSLTRFMHLFKENFNPSVVSFVMETLLNRRFDHDLFGLRPAHPLFHEHPTINDQIASKIICGMIKIKGDIVSISKFGVIFQEDESSVQSQLAPNDSNDELIDAQIKENSCNSKMTRFDSIIFATGYYLDYPFLCNELKSQILSGNSVNLYKYVFPIFEDDNEMDDSVNNMNIAFIGVPNALGPLFPIAEIQSRWVVQVIKGSTKLPSKMTMKKHLYTQEIQRKSKFTHRLRHGVQVEWIPYLDDIASQFGANVNMFDLFKSDFKLWCKLYFGPSVPYQYRLVGPHTWSQARNAILTVRQRIDAPLNASGRSNKSTCGLDQVSNNPKYRDHIIIYTLFYGVLVVALMDMMNLFY